MNASLSDFPSESFTTSASRRIQINTSPNDGEVDLSPLGEHGRGHASLDLVSLADLLRNAFVYPPHTIFKDVKLAATGFDPSQDMHENPRFHYPYQSVLAPARPSPEQVDGDALLQTYHRLLCDAITRSTSGIRSPWLLQSGGKDSTSMAIALADARPDATCLTYLGGREEDEVASARFVATQLGLRHEALVCDPGRAYDRYLAVLPRIPLLCADFAALSYIDLATEVSQRGGDGLIDALGADPYFGTPVHNKERVQTLLARSLPVPQALFQSRMVSGSFKLCFALATLQMHAFERYFPGSRFSDEEVDELFGWNISQSSRKRIQMFEADIAAAESAEAVRRITLVVGESSWFIKGMNAAHATSLRLVYPYADPRFRDWVFNHVPSERLIGPDGTNKVLMRQYIMRRFKHLPYVQAKGCFRFDVRGLARQRFDQVYAFAQQLQVLLPGAPRWLEKHRDHLHNKYFASKFYLLALVLPWLLSRMHTATVSEDATVDEKVAP